MVFCDCFDEKEDRERGCGVFLVVIPVQLSDPIGNLYVACPVDRTTIRDMEMIMIV